MRIFKTYGADAIALVTENPYRLARDIRGIGFVTADQIAQRLGIPKTSMLRARAGITYALLQAVEAGDCGLPEAELLTLAEKLLEVDRGLLSEALALEINERAVLADSIDGQACVWLPHLRHAEDAIALAVRRLGIGEPPWPRIDADKAIDWVETRLGVTLAPAAARRGRQGAVCQDTGRHRGARRRQDHYYSRHPDHPACQGCDAAACCRHRPGTLGVRL